MNSRIIFIIAFILALLLHSGAGMMMLHDEKKRIQAYLEAPELAVIQLIPPEQQPLLSAPELENNDLADKSLETAAEEIIEKEANDAFEETAASPAADEAQPESTEDGEAEIEAETKPEISPKSHPEADYRQNISKGGDLMRESILPPREEGEYRRKVSVDNDPYKKLVEDAIALLEQTPFLDKDWNNEPVDEDAPSYYSQEFLDLLKKYNPTDPIQREDHDEEAELSPVEADNDPLDQWGNPQPVTLIVNQIASPVDLAEQELLAKQQEEIKQQRHYNQLINAAGSQIRRQEYNVALTSSQCYDTYIKGSNRRYSAIVMIFENPKGTGIYKSTGNLQLDSCIIEMTNQFIQIPAEMERIRKNAPRMGNGKGYLLNASF